MLGQIGGSLINAGMSYFNNKQNIKHQKEFAQNSIQWKVADAKKAGIHPIYALGNQATSFAPQSLGGMPDFAAVGQNLDRAAAQNQDHTTRAAAQLATEKIGLENELLRANINRINTEIARNPPLPGNGTALIPGQGQTAGPLPGVVIAPDGHKIELPQYMPNLSIGSAYKTNPNFSDAQSYEDRYGEFAGSVLGLINVLADAHQISKPGMQKILNGLRRSRPREDWYGD